MFSFVESFLSIEAVNYTDKRTPFVNCILAEDGVSFCLMRKVMQKSVRERMESPNLYEAAFETWLAERRISYRAVPQGPRAVPEGPQKRFDYLLCPGGTVPILAEVKGRTFEGSSLVGRRGLDGWTTRQDLQALQQWEDVFVRHYPGCRAVFVFVFCLKQPDVDADGLEIFVHNGRRFVFLAVEAGEYRTYAVQRSPKWRTVTLKAEDFRRCTVPLEEYLETIWNE